MWNYKKSWILNQFPSQMDSKLSDLSKTAETSRVLNQMTTVLSLLLIRTMKALWNAANWECMSNMYQLQISILLSLIMHGNHLGTKWLGSTQIQVIITNDLWTYSGIKITSIFYHLQNWYTISSSEQLSQEHQLQKNHFLLQVKYIKCSRSDIHQ